MAAWGPCTVVCRGVQERDVVREIQADVVGFSPDLLKRLDER